MPSRQSYMCREFLRKRKNWDLPLSELRQIVEQDVSGVKIPGNIKVLPVMADNVPAEWISPLNSPKDKVILYLHGGGYVMGSCHTHRALTANIAQECGICVLLLDYRLAPEYVFPAALEDSISAYKWLLQEGFLPKNIVIAGDSAGGGLTIATLVALRDKNEPLPKAAVCISPLTDLKYTGESIITKAKVDPWINQHLLDLCNLYLGDSDAGMPLISPLYADLHNLPPILIHVGNDEILLSDSIRLADKAKEAGGDVTLHIWKNMWHVFHAFAPMLPEARNAIEEIGEYIKKRMR